MPRMRYSRSVSQRLKGSSPGPHLASGWLFRRDPAFRLVVNRALAQLYAGQGIAEIYDRWFGKVGQPGPLLAAMYYLNAFSE